ncbi:MAG: hypothetical protein GX444_21710, partial [Myxococcales bacterium]|nr:hypothetical protein [Myxococcales bacterium]
MNTRIRALSISFSIGVLLTMCFFVNRSYPAQTLNNKTNPENPEQYYNLFVERFEQDGGFVEIDMRTGKTVQIAQGDSLLLDRDR